VVTDLSNVVVLFGSAGNDRFHKENIQFPSG